MTPQKAEPSHRIILWVQVIGATGSMLLLLVAGIMGGSTSPFVARLTAQDSPIPMTLTEASWMVSLLNMGRLIGAVPGAASVYYLGSKNTLLLNGSVLILGWTSFIVADAAIWLHVGRFFGGFATGVTFGSFPLYLGEVSSPAIRGALVTYASIGLPVGTVIGNAIGACVSIPVFGSIGLVLTIILIFLFMWVPESPHHLVRVNKMEQARRSILRYNPGVDVETEIKSLQDFVNASKSITIADKLREINTPANRKAGVFAVLLFALLQTTGMNSVLFYMENIFTTGGLTVISPASMVTIVGVAGILSGLAAIYLTDKWGRKTLWNVSSIGVILTMGALGAHFALLDSGFDPAKLQWLVISSALAYEVVIFVGMIPVPNTVLSELFAPNIKSIAACLGNISVGLFSFILSKTYQPLLDATNQTVVFWLYAAAAGLSLIFGLTVMPETKGKSLQEIQDMLHKVTKSEQVTFL